MENSRISNVSHMSRPSNITRTTNVPRTENSFSYLLTENKHSGTTYFANNYDEVPVESLKLNRINRDVILKYQRQVRMWNKLDQNGETVSDEYLLATYDPLTPMRFIDPEASSVKKTVDLNTLSSD